MDWTASTWWWIATAALVAAELATGTFYLLMLAVGTSASALGAHAGLGMSAQLIVGATVGVAAIVAWHRRRPRRSRDVASNPDVNIDVGSRVRVDAWGADGTARIKYRGAAWNARFAGSGVPAPGEHVISAVHGSELMLDRIPS